MAFLSQTAAAAASGMKPNVILLARLSFDAAERRLWMGEGDIEVESQIWQGMGVLGSIGPINGVSNDSASSLTLQLSALDAEISRMAYAEADLVKNRPVVVYIAFFQPGTGAPLDGLAPLYSGRMDNLKSLRTAVMRRISVICEGWFTNRSQSANGMYSDRDQQARHPGDKSMEFMPSFINRQVKWPSAG